MNDRASPTKQERARRFFEWAHGFAAMRMAFFGLRLGLFEALRSAPEGLTAPELSAALGLDPTYVAAWAKAAYACELLSYDPATERFRLAPDMEDLLLNDADPLYMAGIPLSLAIESRQVDRLLENFRTGGGIPFGEYGPDLVESLEALSKAAYEVYLPNVLLPSVPGLRERLSTGGKILELGCGAGVGLLSLARAFPHCTVTGVDPDELSIARARERIQQAGLADRVAAEVMRSEDLNVENVFDFVYVQTALHEMDDVAAALVNTRRALVDGGVLLITEVRGAERVEDATGPYQAVLAHMDLFYEIPQSLAKGGLGVGFLNKRQVESLALSAGFAEVRELDLPVPVYAAFYAVK
ncbi:MAG TPA: class I SAM-dependent methyltransferase [Dehalococcoidia bacterium]|nr:class I SAM-dependent methyltransferase [Dehalococcoidia bacterium]